MLYELRTYEIIPGRMAAINQRFANVTNGLFEKHGIRVVGYFENLVGVNNQLIYIVQWENLAEREQRWSAFMADPEWHKARAESEKDGPIVARVINSIMKPTAYSALQ